MYDPSNDPPGLPGRSYATIKALRAGEMVAFEGMGLVASEDQTPTPGRTYIGERITGPHLATVARYVAEDNLVGGYVIAKENVYPFDRIECVMVDIVDLPEDTTAVADTPA